MQSSLAGIKIIDLSRVLGGPYCTQTLGDHGADVIKVEPPMGDETRGWGPPFLDGEASYFLGLNRNKRGMTLDLTKESGREVLLKLLETADVLVENFKTGTLEKWGIGGEFLAERFPRLIHCRVSGFGADGPLGGLPGYDAVLQSMTGLMSVNGEYGADPLRVGLPVVDMVTGLNATIAVLLALQHRAVSGKGQFVEAALFDSGLSLMHPHAPNYFLNGKVPSRTGNDHPNISPYSVYATKTQPIFLAIGNDRQFAKLCEMIGASGISSDPRFLTNGDRVTNRDDLRTELEAALANHDGPPLAEKMIAGGVPCGPLLNTEEALAHPHTAHREMVVSIDEYKGLGAPAKLEASPASYRHRPPGLSQDSEAVLQEAGFSNEEIKKLMDDKIVLAPKA